MLHEAALRHVIDAALALDPVLPLTEARFQAMIDDRPARTAPARAPHRRGASSRCSTCGGKSSPRRNATPAWKTTWRASRRTISPRARRLTQLAHLPRYLRAVAVRAERAAVNPAKDAEKARALVAVCRLGNPRAAAAREAFRWLLEEFRVSIFAQELGTAQPVSAQRLMTLGAL